MVERTLILVSQGHFIGWKGMQIVREEKARFRFRTSVLSETLEPSFFLLLFLLSLSLSSLLLLLKGNSVRAFLFPGRPVAAFSPFQLRLPN